MAGLIGHPDVLLLSFFAGMALFNDAILFVAELITMMYVHILNKCH